MSSVSHIADILGRIIMHPTGGVVSLVDELLLVCGEHGLQLDWQAEHCRVRSFGGGWEELTEIPLRKSVFRAILARIAVLCNERSPNSVSPYGGQGELSSETNPPTVFRVTFANTPEEQKLELQTENGPPGREKTEVCDGESILPQKP
jgi:hypothetical protein